MHSRTWAWLVRKVPFATLTGPTDSGKPLLVSVFKRRLKTGTGSQPPIAASDPALPEELMRNGLVVMIAVLMSLTVPRVRLTLPVSDASRQARPWPGRCGQR